MIKNYFTVMLRSMLRQKFHTFINVLGLSVGIAFAMLIGIFISGELEVNQSLKDVNRLFLVQSKVEGQAEGIEFFSPPLLAKTVVEKYPAQFEDYFRFWDRNITVSKGDKHFRIQSMIGDKSFLRMFGFKVLHGDSNTPLDQPNSIIITEDVAMRFFNKKDAVNETLSVSTEQNGIRDYKITAVIAEPDDKNTVSDLMNMNAQMFLTLESYKDFFTAVDPDKWEEAMIAYIKLTSIGNKNDSEKILNDVLQKEAPSVVSENRLISLNPLNDYYLLTNHGAVLKLVISLSCIVVFILVLAITNFVNISVAGSFNRMKEVGIRKALGSVRRELIIQFMMESLLLTFLSGVIGLVLYQVLHPVFNKLLETQLPSLGGLSSELWLWMVAGILLIGLIAGAYPGIFQSSTRPMESLKGKARSVQGTISFSRILISLQFVITIFIFISAIILSRQTAYFLEQDLGYNKSHVLIVFSVPRWWNDVGFQKMEAAKAQFLQSPRVKSVSLSWGSPGWGIGGFENNIYKAGSAPLNGAKVHVTGADESFNEVYDLRLIEGEFLFSDAQQWSGGKLVLNESARSAIGVKVGEKVKIEGIDSLEYTVAGIVNDFYYESMHQAIKPMAFMHNRDFTSYRVFSFRLDSNTPMNSVSEVERLWKKVFPDEPFNYFFADEKLQAMYTTELQLKKASAIASILMLIIVMTGVIGLVSLNVSRRTKEVGIRKALGASITGILLMFSKEYARLTLVSFIVAIPLAYYFASSWLDNFVYHIDLTWWMFAGPGIFVLAMTVLIVSIQCYRTAATSPVSSLRYE